MKGRLKGERREMDGEEKAESKGREKGKLRERGI